MEEAAANFGTIDILVNNAGTNIPKPRGRVTEEDWDRTLDLNVKSAFFCCQEPVSTCASSSTGRSSTLLPDGFRRVFQAQRLLRSKGGLTQLTRALAIEWAKDRINVNAIAPTFIETPLTEESPRIRNSTDVCSRIPLGRLATEEDFYWRAAVPQFPGIGYGDRPDHPRGWRLDSVVDSKCRQQGNEEGPSQCRID